VTHARGPQRTILLTGAALFVAFAVVAFVFRRLDVSQETLSIVGGGFAYVFLVAVAVILLRAWRARRRDAGTVAARYAVAHPAVRTAVGDPVRAEHPQGEVPGGRAPAQANLAVPVSGPRGSARIDLVMARLGRDWEVLSGTLVVDGERVPLGEGPAAGPADDEE
jgi:hypothetical protein